MMEIKTRAEWLARPPKRTADIMLPSPQLYLHHSADDRTGESAVRAIQEDHQGRGWWDIAYSFLIDPDDLTIYEGRGAGKLGGHTFGYNSISHGICVLGNFMHRPVRQELVDTLAHLVGFGFTQEWWPDRFTGGHRKVRSTLCPGDNLNERIPEINRRVQEVLREPEEPPPDIVSRLAERVWNMEVLALIDHAYRFNHNKTPSRTIMNKLLMLAREEGVDEMLERIVNERQ